MEIVMGDVKKLGLKALNVATLGTSGVVEDALKSPGIPEVKDPAAAPDPDSLEAKRKTQSEAVKRKTSGRTSTILSGNNTLG